MSPPEPMRIGGKALRWVGVVLLVAGVVAVYRYFPTRPPQSWQTVHGFHLDAEECRQLRVERQAVDFPIPEEVEAQVSVAEVAEKFHLELPLVCAANQRSGCGEDPLTPGVDTLVLPLSRDPAAVSREAP